MRIGIIGDGLTSLTLAKALVNRNIYVDILSDKKKQIIDKSRTIGITKSNVEYFNNNIINIDKIIWKLNKIEIFSEKLNQEKLLEFQNINQELFSMVRSFDLYNILEKNLKKNIFFKKHNNKKITNAQNKYNILINLDFSNLITKKFFSKKIIKKYKSFAYTVIIKHEKIENVVARQIFTKIGPLAFLPISNKETSIVYSIKNNPNLKKENLIELINLHNPKYKIKEVKKISSFELISVSLRNYYHKNILAFGELIHKIHPLAGQGFNMTVRDIKILLEIIQNRIDLGLPINSSVNKEFQNNTKHRNFIFSNGIDFIYEFFNYENKNKNKFFVNSLKYFVNKNSINNILKKIADNGFNY